MTARRRPAVLPGLSQHACSPVRRGVAGPARLPGLSQRACSPGLGVSGSVRYPARPGLRRSGLPEFASAGEAQGLQGSSRLPGLPESARRSPAGTRHLPGDRGLHRVVALPGDLGLSGERA
ncbi:hypothetical protein A8924_6192 [Saccharopolyspora erythraea NRRL 2338]|uniref:Uncharacterized protein n=1 Tax=Saccharopolyspora erythraea TaxID=1836 RepID=A0ABN1C719_SACER|nr:hypothetical protein A8924_6192 [Saccharopolyspora erythraea NRRL 2338]